MADISVAGIPVAGTPVAGIPVVNVVKYRPGDRKHLQDFGYGVILILIGFQE